jgi:hypothetical protein
MEELVTYTKGNEKYQYYPDRVWYISKGTKVRFDGGKTVVLNKNYPVHPIQREGEPEGSFYNLTLFSSEENILVRVVVDDDTRGFNYSDVVIKSSNITNPKITFNVARAYWSDMPGGVDWDPFVIWMDGDIKDECLLSYDYLVQFGDDYPQLKPIMLEMEMKGYTYLWLY